MTMYSGQPLSQETSWLVQNELASLEHDFASGSILGVPAHCLIGVEIDFCIREKNTNDDQRTTLELSRASMAAELSLLVPRDQEQAQRKADWIKQIPHLSLAELINYQIYRRLSAATLDQPNVAMYFGADDSPETTLEFVFGSGLHQTGYYDNPGLFEMRTQAARPTIAAERIKRALAVTKEVAEEFGATFYYEGSHTNFSVWAPDQNSLKPMHALDNEEGQEIARKGVAGIFYALRDSMAIVKPPRSYSPSRGKANDLLRAHPERDGTFRVVPDRFEQRLRVGEENHDLNALALMAGFAYGVGNESIDTSFITTTFGTLLTAGEGYAKTRDLYLLRALQQSLQPDGSFVFPGVSEFNENRGNGMLSSLMGTGIYAKNSASHIIKSLVSKVTLEEDALKVNEAGFNRAVNDASFYLTAIGSPKDTITERLKRLRVLPNSAMITGSLECGYPNALDFHADLAEYSSRPSLSYIGAHVLEAVGRERASAFTHEEAVFKYLDNEIIDSPRLSTAEKVVQLQIALDKFPDVDLAVLKERVQREVGQRVDHIAQGVKEVLQEEDSPRRIRKHSERMSSLRLNLELYDTLAGHLPPRSAEEFLEAQESARSDLRETVLSLCLRGVQKFRNFYDRK